MKNSDSYIGNSVKTINSIFRCFDTPFFNKVF